MRRIKIRKIKCLLNIEIKEREYTFLHVKRGIYGGKKDTSESSKNFFPF